MKKALSKLYELRQAKIKSIEVVNQNKDFHSMMLLNTMIKDPSKNTEEALSIVYQLLRSGAPPNLETAQKKHHACTGHQKCMRSQQRTVRRCICALLNQNNCQP